MEREHYISKINNIVKEYLQTPENERSLTKLASKCGVKRQTISKYLKEPGFDVINYQNLCKIDQTVFDSIDTEEKAYWLGFLFADGNIASKEDKLEINLSSKDIDHLNKFKKFINSDAKDRICKTKSGHEQCRFSVRNKHLWEELNSKGCIPNKTLILKFPDEKIFKDKSLIRHFIRGYFDGDGTIGVYNGKYGTIFNIGIASTKSFLEDVQKYIGIKGVIKNATCNTYESKVFVLHYSSLKARRVSRYLYENCNVCLTRKYNIYEMFCRAEEESSVLKSSKIGELCDENTEVSSEITKGSETL